MRTLILTIFLAITIFSFDALAATMTTTGTFSAFGDSDEVEYFFSAGDPPEPTQNIRIFSEPVFGLTKFDPSLGTLNEMTINAEFSYQVTASIEVEQVLDDELPTHSASFSVNTGSFEGDRGHVYVRYTKGSSSFFMTNEFFTPSIGCSGSSEPCANDETSQAVNFDAPEDILSHPLKSQQIDLADFVGDGVINRISMAILLPEGSEWVTDNVAEAYGEIFVAIDAGTVSIEYDFTPTAVPVPAALWLFMSAAGGLFGMQRFSKTKVG